MLSCLRFRKGVPFFLLYFILFYFASVGRLSAGVLIFSAVVSALEAWCTFFVCLNYFKARPALAGSTCFCYCVSGGGTVLGRHATKGAETPAKEARF